MRYRSNVLECSRCGNQELERRTGWFRDADYHELLQEYLELEAEAKELRRLLARERWSHDNTRSSLESSNFLISHLGPLALAQLRVLIALHDEPQPA